MCCRRPHVHLPDGGVGPDQSALVYRHQVWQRLRRQDTSTPTEGIQHGQNQQGRQHLSSNRYTKWLIGMVEMEGVKKWDLEREKNISLVFSLHRADIPPTPMLKDEHSCTK